MSDYQKAQTDLDYVLSEDGHSSAAVEKLLGLVDYIDNQQQRIRKLEEVLRQVRSEYNSIPYAQWSATMHRVNDVLEQPR